LDTDIWRVGVVEEDGQVCQGSADHPHLDRYEDPDRQGHGVREQIDFWKKQIEFDRLAFCNYFFVFVFCNYFEMICVLCLLKLLKSAKVDGS
jgi:hypothetical protein